MLKTNKLPFCTDSRLRIPSTKIPNKQTSVHIYSIVNKYNIIMYKEYTRITYISKFILNYPPRDIPTETD